MPPASYKAEFRESEELVFSPHAKQIDQKNVKDLKTGWQNLPSVSRFQNLPLRLAKHIGALRSAALGAVRRLDLFCFELCISHVKKKTGRILRNRTFSLVLRFYKEIIVWHSKSLLADGKLNICRLWDTELSVMLAVHNLSCHAEHFAF